MTIPGTLTTNLGWNFGFILSMNINQPVVHLYPENSYLRGLIY